VHSQTVKLESHRKVTIDDVPLLVLHTVYVHRKANFIFVADNFKTCSSYFPTFVWKGKWVFSLFV
jgi:predicted nucleic acid-binding Zn finger protein